MLCQLASVAPFTGAWIETPGLVKKATYKGRRTLHGCVDLNPCTTVTKHLHARSHPSRVRGLKLQIFAPIERILPGRTLHGCVD
jgi:hypothetical protein